MCGVTAGGLWRTLTSEDCSRLQAVVSRRRFDCQCLHRPFPVMTYIVQTPSPSWPHRSVITNNEAFLKGKYVELGMHSSGYFGSRYRWHAARASKTIIQTLVLATSPALSQTMPHVLSSLFMPAPSAGLVQWPCASWILRQHRCDESLGHKRRVSCRCVPTAAHFTGSRYTTTTGGA